MFTKLTRGSVVAALLWLCNEHGAAGPTLEVESGRDTTMAKNSWPIFGCAAFSSAAKR
jgi:hypothetical protein